MYGTTLSVGTKSGKRAVMYLCLDFYDCSIGFFNCSDSVVSLVFYFINQPWKMTCIIVDSHDVIMHDIYTVIYICIRILSKQEQREIWSFTICFLLGFAYALLYILFKLWKTSEGAHQMCFHLYIIQFVLIDILKHLPMQDNRYHHLSLQAWFTTVSRLVGHSISF